MFQVYCWLWSFCHRRECCTINQCSVASSALVLCVYLLIPQGEHLLHGGDPSAGEAFIILAHFDGLQPLRHRPEHGAITAAGAGQANGYPGRNNVHVITHHFLPHYEHCKHVMISRQWLTIKSDARKTRWRRQIFWFKLKLWYNTRQRLINKCNSLKLLHEAK